MRLMSNRKVFVLFSETIHIYKSINVHELELNNHIKNVFSSEIAITSKLILANLWFLQLEYDK